MPIQLASTLIPRKSTAKIEAIAIRVLRAFSLSGGLKAATPSEIASTPESATAPEENARRMSTSPSGSIAVSAAPSGGTYAGIIPFAHSYAP